MLWPTAQRHLCQNPSTLTALALVALASICFGADPAVTPAVIPAAPAVGFLDWFNLHSGAVLGFALDHQGMRPTLLGLVAIFTPLMGLVLVPLVIRIRREANQGETRIVAIN